MIEIVHEISLFTPSQKDGVMTVPLKVTKITEDVVASITLTIDGMNVTTPLISFILSIKAQPAQKIHRMDFTSYPEKNFADGLSLDEKFEIEVKFYDLIGNDFDLSGYYFFLRPYFYSVSQADLPNSFVKLNTPDSPKVSGNRVKFSNSFFERASTGHYDLRVYVATDENAENIIYASNRLKVYVVDMIDIVALQDVVPKDSFSYAKLKERKPSRLVPRFTEFQKLPTVHEEFKEVEIETVYVLIYFLYSYINGPLKNTKISDPLPYFQEYPSLMKAAGGPGNYFKLKPQSSTTDENGTYFIEVTIKSGGTGGYVVSMDFGTCISIPVPFKTENVLTKLQITGEPHFEDKSKLDKNGVAYTGTKFDIKARVRVQVEKGTRAGYIIIAHPIAISQSVVASDLFPQSIFDMDDKKENYLAWVTALEGSTYAISDSDGEAVFEDLTIWDLSGENATVKYQFAVGDRYEGAYLVTNATDRNYTFKPSLSFKMLKQPSKFVSAATFINPYPVVKAISQTSGRPFYLLNMRLTEIFNKETQDNEIGDTTNKYMTGTVCLFNTSSDSGHGLGCAFKKTSKKNKLPETYEISFDTLKWTAYGVNSYIKMSFATYLQHYTANEALSQRMNLETTANSITFISDPPKSVSVNEIFQVTVKVSVSGGTPLPGAVVS